MKCMYSVVISLVLFMLTNAVLGQLSEVKDPVDREAEIADMLGRIEQRALSESEGDAVVRTALQGIAETFGKEQAAWILLFFRAGEAGYVGEDEWTEFVAGSYRSKLLLRDPVVVEDPFVIQLNFSGGRIQPEYMDSALKLLPASVDGQEIGMPEGGESVIRFDRRTARWPMIQRRVTPDRVAWASLAEGTHTVSCRAVLEATSLWEKPYEYVARIPIELDGEVRLVSSATESYEFVESATMAQAIEEGLSLEYLRIRSRQTAALDADGRESMKANLRLSLQDVPMDVSFSIGLRMGGEDEEVQEVGFVAVNKRNRGWCMLTRDVKGKPGEQVDLILRTDTKGASRTMGMHRLWSGEVAIEDAPVVWEE